ncbi:MAG TPA: FAD-dependent oxidoreductase [Nitrosomonas sp.]|nr:FAD-dependent oxidoreductase [Nitrosomonas sp.]HMW20630.1 FAD-dependent oxidoreductase [Nitrosomonas sp.]HMW69606.1 FAD-dependent oxidoreductase [Nitrosomonas sp.]HMY61351.1 FAD-dependent oxidoreductase [Nitrosomonas sp.]HMY90895.1 FAD-dependent oxidoreductase [Nitrosomonas sp.]
MAVLPFYISNKKNLKIVIVGGGYAGIAALTTIARYQPSAEITLIDPKIDHIKITHLHETFRYPLTDFLIPFTDIEQEFGCRHLPLELPFSESTLLQWERDKTISINNESIPFDYLLIASGALNNNADQDSGDVMGLNAFMKHPGSEILSQFLSKPGTEAPISVIGGGATGIQFLFEIEHFLRYHKYKNKLRLIDSGDQVLKQFPDRFARYVEAAMKNLNIEYYPTTYFRGQQHSQIRLEDKKTSHQFELPSSLTFLFSGKSQGSVLKANAFGQVIVDQQILQHIFVAGDCAYYQSIGSNALTAQSAVRKGKLAARNLLRHSGLLKILEPYLHRDIGYVVSLGPADAIGWLALENNVVTGLAAYTIKEIVEAQYDLLLAGIDTYLL